MIQYELTADDLADTRFAISPIQELVCSLWALRDPGRYTLHLPWRQAALAATDPDDLHLLMSLVGKSRGLPDFLTPRPATFAPTVEEEIDLVRRTPPELVERDIAATHAPARRCLPPCSARRRPGCWRCSPRRCPRSNWRGGCG